MEDKLLAQQRAKEALSEKEPQWLLYCDLFGRKEEFLSGDYWKLYLDRASDAVGIGDEEDRWNTLKDNFNLDEQDGGLEEFDGLNHEEAKAFIIIVNLPMLMRGHAVQVQAT